LCLVFNLKKREKEGKGLGEGDGSLEVLESDFLYEMSGGGKFIPLDLPDILSMCLHPKIRKAVGECCSASEGR
jgi:hypothetical protein